jgi:hypothetical protein
MKAVQLVFLAAIALAPSQILAQDGVEAQISADGSVTAQNDPVSHFLGVGHITVIDQRTFFSLVQTMQTVPSTEPLPSVEEYEGAKHQEYQGAKHQEYQSPQHQEYQGSHRHYG